MMKLKNSQILETQTKEIHRNYGLIAELKKERGRLELEIDSLETKLTRTVNHIKGSLDIIHDKSKDLRTIKSK